MSRFLMVVSAWLCVTVVGFADGKDVLLLRGPKVDAKLAENCFKFMDHNVRGKLRVDHTLFSVDGFAPKEQLKVFSAMRSEQDALVVVLVNSPASTNSVVIYSRDLGAAVVNIAPMVNDREFSKKIRLALIDRSAMYALGRVAGMEPCLNPFCALSEYHLVQKDKMPGRNYCPNCIDRVAEKLEKLGVKEVADGRKPGAVK